MCLLAQPHRVPESLVGIVDAAEFGAQHRVQRPSARTVLLVGARLTEGYQGSACLTAAPPTQGTANEFSTRRTQDGKRVNRHGEDQSTSRADARSAPRIARGAAELVRDEPRRQAPDGSSVNQQAATTSASDTAHARAMRRATPCRARAIRLTGTKARPQSGWVDKHVSRRVELARATAAQGSQSLQLRKRSS